MKVFHAMLGSGFIGALLAVCNITVVTWQFWVIMIAANLWYFTRPQED